jgi:hypothetical protein
MDIGVALKGQMKTSGLISRRFLPADHRYVHETESEEHKRFEFDGMM